MKRTKLKDRILPSYTKGEEIMNMVTHIIGGVIGIVALVLCVIFAANSKNGYAIGSSIVFGVSMILLILSLVFIMGLVQGRQQLKK